MFYLIVPIGVDGSWVYQVDRDVGLGVGNQAGGRIDVEGGADDDEDVSILHRLGSRFYHRNILAKEDDERAQETAIACLGARLHLAIILWQLLNVAIVVRIVGRTNLGELAVQVDDVLGTSLLVQVIYVLGDDGHLEIFLQFLDELMPLVRLGGLELVAQHIVEVGY